MPSWIDFAKLRENLRFEDVLRMYDVEVNARGDQHMGVCPLPGHTGERKVSFSANLKRGIFQCFGCKAKGNVLDFAVLMNGVDPKDGRELKKVALMLREKFCPDSDKAAPPEKPRQEEPELPLSVNTPLDFELKDLDARHPTLAAMGLSTETIARFGIGFCSRGYLSERIAIPLHDADARLIGYAGLALDDSVTMLRNRDYRFPEKRERKGQVLDFQRERFLYNAHRLKKCEALLIVPQFQAVWHLAQAGYPEVVATMGSACSDEQAALILILVRPSAVVWVMPGGGAGGEKMASSFFAQLGHHVPVRWVKLDEGRQPTDLTASELGRYLG